MHISGDATIFLFVFTNLAKFLFTENCNTLSPFALVIWKGNKPFLNLIV